LHGREAGGCNGVGGEAAVDVDLVDGRELGEDDVGGEVTFLRGVGSSNSPPQLFGTTSALSCTMGIRLGATPLSSTVAGRYS
jgi:hypothetical protein